MKHFYIFFACLLPILSFSQDNTTLILNDINDVLEEDSIAFDFQTTSDSTIRYAVVFYKGKDSEYASIRIDKKKKTVFEWVDQASYPNIDLKEIERRREEWMELCNQHDAATLVQALYDDDAIYYNHRPVIRGHHDITEEYQYMNREEYELTLSPLYLQAVRRDLVYEIGQCSGSYNGQYVLIWKKMKSGIWKIIMDSNI